MEKDPKDEGDEKEPEVVNVDIINIIGTSRMTQSGRSYTHEFKVMNKASKGPVKETMVATP